MSWLPGMQNICSFGTPAAPTRASKKLATNLYSSAFPEKAKSPVARMKSRTCPLCVAGQCHRTLPSTPRPATRHRSHAYECRICEASRSGARQPVLSGNNPGIQREASAAGKARRSGARVLSDVSTPCSSQGGDNAAGLALAGADDRRRRRRAAVRRGRARLRGCCRISAAADRA